MAGLLYLGLFVLWDWMGDLILFLLKLLFIPVGIGLVFLLGTIALLAIIYS